jgi:hypothetical protein
VNALLWFLLGGVSFGTVVGLVLFMLLAENVRRRTRLEALGEKRWRRAPFADNGGGVVDRRRSPDFNLVTRSRVRSAAQPHHLDS